MLAHLDDHRWDRTFLDAIYLIHMVATGDGGPGDLRLKWLGHDEGIGRVFEVAWVTAEYVLTVLGTGGTDQRRREAGRKAIEEDVHMSLPEDLDGPRAEWLGEELLGIRWTRQRRALASTGSAESSREVVPEASAFPEQDGGE